MKKMKKFAALLLAVSMAAGMVACGSSDKKEETTKKEETKKDDKETKKLEGTLKVVTTGDAYQPLFDKFTEEVGPKVEFISMSSGEVLSKLKAEGGTPAADLWFGGGIDAFMDAKDNDLLEKVDFDAADELAPEFKDSDNYWFSKGVTVVGFIVNNDILKEKGLEAPKSWDDLTKEEYQGEVLMSNPAISGTNYAVVNALLQTKGDEEGWKYFEALNKNVDYYSKRGSDPSTKTAAGEVGIGITYINGTLDELKEAAKKIYEHGPKYVLIKGGKSFSPDKAIDVLYDGKEFKVFESEKIDTAYTHGAGCSFAACLTAELAKGESMENAVNTTKGYITEALKESFPLNKFVGPLYHKALAEK